MMSAGIQHWSVTDVPTADRVDYWAAFLQSSYVPLLVDGADPRTFESEVRSARFGAFRVATHRGSAHRLHNGPRELARNFEHSFDVSVLLAGSWDASHRGRLRVQRGDLFLHDSAHPIDLNVRTPFTSLTLHFSEEFVYEWIPNPTRLFGRPISSDVRWGRVLAGYVSQLTPDFILQAPLPDAVLTDHIGALLSLTAAELDGAERAPTMAERCLSDRVADTVRQRCQEPMLSARDIASSLDVSQRTLQRALAKRGETFVSILIQARVDVALRMLCSPSFDRLTTAEIGRRAGFSDPSHFVRVIRRSTGQTPRRLRLARAG
jgi:AraC-like DNA-binding protein